MSAQAEPAVRVRVDPTNPGQFFACCGLLELADRLWSGAEGWFEDGHRFSLRPLCCVPEPWWTLDVLLRVIVETPVRQVDPDDDCSSPIELQEPFNLRLDWWKDKQSGGHRLKVWAGTMRPLRIARAMQSAVGQAGVQDSSILDFGAVVYDPLEPDKKVEPLYFDARRGSNARAIDIGFSPDSLQQTTIAYPAVEWLCLVGLQRCRPLPTSTPRVFDYYTWGAPVEARLTSASVVGTLPGIARRRFRFENAFRTTQRKHKAFTQATAS